MKVVTTYFSDDGKAFTNEKECKEYERRVNGEGKNIIGLNSCGEIIELASCDFFSDAAMVVRLDDEKAVECFKEECQAEGVKTEGIRGPGFYIWGDFIEEMWKYWVPFEDMIERYGAMISKIKGYRDMLSYAK